MSTFTVTGPQFYVIFCLHLGPFTYYIMQKLCFCTTLHVNPHVTLFNSFLAHPIMLYNKLKRHPLKIITEPELDMQNCHNHCRRTGKLQVMFSYKCKCHSSIAWVVWTWNFTYSSTSRRSVVPWIAEKSMLIHKQNALYSTDSGTQFPVKT